MPTRSKKSSSASGDKKRASKGGGGGGGGGGGNGEGARAVNDGAQKSTALAPTVFKIDMPRTYWCGKGQYQSLKNSLFATIEEHRERKLHEQMQVYDERANEKRDVDDEADNEEREEDTDTNEDGALPEYDKEAFSQEYEHALEAMDQVWKIYAAFHSDPESLISENFEVLRRYLVSRNRLNHEETVRRYAERGVWERWNAFLLDAAGRAQLSLIKRDSRMTGEVKKKKANKNSLKKNKNDDNSENHREDDDDDGGEDDEAAKLQKAVDDVERAFEEARARDPQLVEYDVLEPVLEHVVNATVLYAYLVVCLSDFYIFTCVYIDSAAHHLIGELPDRRVVDELRSTCKLDMHRALPSTVLRYIEQVETMRPAIEEQLRYEQREHENRQRRTSSGGFGRFLSSFRRTTASRGSAE